MGLAGPRTRGAPSLQLSAPAASQPKTVGTEATLSSPRAQEPKAERHARVGVRLETLPDDRFEPLRTLNVPEVGPVAAACEAFWFHELLFQIIDVVVCAFLLVYTIYIGYSHTQAVLSGDFLSTGLGPRGSGKRGVRV